MKRNHLLLILVFASIFLSGSIKAQQDIQFTQFVFNGLALNPAYAGYKEVTNLNLMYRAQWTGLSGAPQTTSASIDGLTQNEKVGLGFQVLQDKLGAQTNLNVYGSYAYRLILGEFARLSFGVAVGANQYSIDGSKLYTVDQDPSKATLTQSIIQPDLKAGIFYANEKFFIALSGTDLFSSFETYNPSYLVIKTARHYYFQTGGLITLNPNLQFKPSIIARTDFRGPTNIDLNMFLLFGDRLWLGTTYRTGVKLFYNTQLQSDLISSDSFSIILQYYFSQRFRFGYSYDYSLNALNNISNGSHEISLGYTFFSRHPHLACPRFF